MAKRAVCDVCKTQSDLQGGYNSIPDHWFTLRQKFDDEQHLCSMDCLKKAVLQREASTPQLQPA